MDEKIALMNVARQYQSIKEEIDAVMQEVMQSGNYINGINVKNFEEKFATYIGVNHAIGVGNGTDALVIALRALGIKAGDEVITSAMSFYATAEAIASVGATPVFVDCTSDTYVIDADKIDEKITEKTKAIIPVHLYGHCADMNKICEIAEKNNLYVVEDVAQAAGAEYFGRKAGSLGTISCVSFFPTKNLGAAGDGGIILTDSEELARKCRAYRVHGSGMDGMFTYNQQQGIDEIDNFKGHPPKYFNYLIGYNSRLDEIQAAILSVKLKYLDDWNEKRRKIADEYRSKIDNCNFRHPYVAENVKHIYYVYVICTECRDEVREYLEKQGISTGVYFPVPLHLQKVFKNLGYKKGDFPNAEYLSKQSLAIPMFPELKTKEITRVIDALNTFVER